MAKALWKTTITIWTDHDPNDWELEDLVRDAVLGGGYCSGASTMKIDDPSSDPILKGIKVKWNEDKERYEIDNG